jgi:hypothetical protein
MHLLFPILRLFPPRFPRDDTIIKLGSRSDWKHMKYEKKIEVPGFYHLYFLNCEPQTSVSWLHFEEYNVNAEDGSACI